MAHADAHSLVTRLAELPPGGTLVIEPGEHRVNLVLTQPIHLQGKGDATLLQGVPGSGPVLEILSAGVQVTNLSLEHLDPDGVVLRALPDAPPEISGVTVRAGRVLELPTLASVPLEPDPALARRVDPSRAAAPQQEPSAAPLQTSPVGVEALSSWSEVPVRLYPPTPQLASLQPSGTNPVSQRDALDLEPLAYTPVLRTWLEQAGPDWQSTARWVTCVATLRTAGCTLSPHALLLEARALWHALEEERYARDERSQTRLDAGRTAWCTGSIDPEGLEVRVLAPGKPLAACLLPAGELLALTRGGLVRWEPEQTVGAPPDSRPQMASSEDVTSKRAEMVPPQRVFLLPIEHVALSECGQWAAMRWGARLWIARGGELGPQVLLPFTPSALAISSAGRVALGTAHGQLYFLTCSSAERTHAWEEPAAPEAFPPWTQVQSWRLEAGEEAHSGAIQALVFCREGHTLASADVTGSVTVWHRWPLIPRRSWMGLAEKCPALALSAQGDVLASREPTRLRLWDVETGARLAEAGKLFPAPAVAFSPHGWVASWRTRDRLGCWSFRSGRLVAECLGGEAGPALHWSLEGLRLTGVSEQGAVHVWMPPWRDGESSAGSSTKSWGTTDKGDPAVVLPVRTLASASGPVLGLSLSAHEGVVAQAEHTRIRLWSFSSAQKERTLPFPGAFDALAVSPDGRVIAGSGAGKIQLWQLSTGTRLAETSLPSVRLLSLAWSSSGRMLLGVGEDSLLRAWSGTALEPLRLEWLEPAWRVHRAAYAAGERQPEAEPERRTAPDAEKPSRSPQPHAPARGTALWWRRLLSSRPIPEGHLSEATNPSQHDLAPARMPRWTGLACLPKERLLLRDALGELWLWSLSARRLLSHWHGPEGPEVWMAASVRVPWVALSGPDGSLSLWQLEPQPRLLDRVGVEHGPLTGLLLSGDGRQLIASTQQGAVWVRPVTSEGQLGSAQRLRASGVELLASAHEGGTLAMGSSDGWLEVWSPPPASW